MKNKFLLSFLLAFCVTVGTAQEQKMSTTEISTFQSVMGKASQVKTLTADFVQYKKVGYVKNELVSSGKFYVKNPDKLAWFYNSPTAYTMVFNNKKMMIEEKGKKKTMDIGRSKQFEKISQAIQSNMNGGTYQGTEFSPSYFQTNKLYILKLNPIAKEVKKAMKQLVVSFDKTTYQVVEVMLLDNSNGSTRFVFTNQKINAALADSVFDL
ncbi:LolA family protein [Sphingobacterium tabacisoli]|uniref:Outer membrane lipoprotein carrier protein LolA n=1 Tax=Sphingobacterium tabacisoli TaxID=2044855 RepID=A0ABW5KZW0_9SPHI|nr:outer membrane lipoprotein carrier protein LolA [Sphingobacterium tabacisoli]